MLYTVDQEANLLEVSLEGEGVVQLGGLYDPGVEDVAEEAGHAGGQDHAEQGHVVHIYQHLSTHIYSYLHMSTHIYTNLPIPTHIHMSQMLYAGQSDRQDVTFFGDF